jgi:uncharacterized LabA/DUF88 family protein
MLRCLFLVDGYNLYHSLDDADQHTLKWLDLHKLAEKITAPLPEHSVKVYWFSAYAEWNKEPLARHRAYAAALRSVGVHIVLGNFKKKRRHCKNCSNEWHTHEEKETDVNIAVHLVRAAYERSYERMYIVTGDTDITPAIRMAKEIYPEGLITITAPPGRDRYISSLLNVADNQQRLSFDMFRQAQLPDIINNSAGDVVAQRPDKYSLALASSNASANIPSIGATLGTAATHP